MPSILIYRIKRLFVAVALLFSQQVAVLYAQTQQLVCDKLDINDGLSQNSVQSILQDQKGVLWFGTQDGLNYFDAYDIKVYKRSVNGGNTTISDNFIKCIYEDSKNRLWLGTENGVTAFKKPYISNFLVFAPSNAKDKSGLLQKNIDCIVEDQNHFVFFGTPKGLHVFNEQNSTITPYKHSFILAQNVLSSEITAAIVDHHGYLWVGTRGNGILRFNSKLKDKFTHYLPNNTDGKALLSANITGLYKDSRNRIWIGSAAGINIYDPQTNQWYKIPNNGLNPESSLPQGIIRSIVEDREGNVWFAVNELLCSYNFTDQKLQLYKLSIKDANANSNYGAISELLVDKAGTLWIGTENSGVLKYDPYLARFDLFKMGNTYPNILDVENVWGILECSDDKRILVATEQNITVIDRANKSWTLLSKSVSGVPLTQLEILSITEVDKKWFMLATRGEGVKLMTLSADKQQVEQLLEFGPNETDSSKLAYGTVIMKHKDRRGNIWCGGYGGFSLLRLNRAEPAKSTFLNFKPNENDPKALHNGVIRSMCHDSNDNYWVGTNDGLYRLKFNQNFEIIDLKLFLNNPNDKTSLSHNKVQYIAEDKNGMLWIGTGGGLNKLNPKTEKFELIGGDEDAMKAIVYAALLDEQNMIWLSTNNGIVKYDLKTKKASLFNSKDGLQSNEFNSGAFFQSASGEMFFGGIHGFNAFFPDKIKPSTYNPPVLIADIRINSRSIFKERDVLTDFNESPISVKTLNLDYTQNTIAIDIAALNYRLTEKNRFKHKLEPLDKDWVLDGKNRIISYNQLEPGRYTLRIVALNNDGIGDEAGTTLEIVISPPWWKTNLFIATLTVLIISIIWCSVYWYNRNVKNQNKRLEAEVAKRTIEIVSKNEELVEQKSQLERSFTNIRTLSEIGQTITAKLDTRELISSVYESVTRLLEANGFGIGIYNMEEESIDFLGFMENGEALPDSRDYLSQRNRLSVWCFSNNKEVFINDYDTEINSYITETKVRTSGDGEPMLSIIYLPLSIDNRTIGVITVQSLKTNAYSTSDMELLRSLASTASIAISNANAYTQIRAINDEVRKKNQAMKDSLRYGKTIQQALLPRDLDRYFSDSFILFRPRETVSGDFYWATFADNKIFLAVLDCTGHGVPGAFVALIGQMLLHEIVDRNHVTQPSSILSNLHEEIRMALHQNDKQNTDGMDACICSVAEIDENNHYKITFAGAKRPLYYVKNGQLCELKGDKKSVGGMQKEISRTFTQTEIEATKGDSFYFTTDGFADQNNAKREKIGTNTLKDVLAEISDKPMLKQRKHLSAYFDKHRDQEIQRDDVTIIGVRL